MLFTRLSLDGLIMVEPRIIEDARGFFMESYKESEFRAQGITHHFVQDNLSGSRRGVLRGLHFQREPYAQARLVQVVRGAVWDVVVDLRPGSASYARWQGLELSAKNSRMLFVPEGFAHGFLALEDGTELLYKASREYNRESEGGLRWDDPELSIEWPFRDVLVSDRDGRLPYLRDL